MVEVHRHGRESPTAVYAWPTFDLIDDGPQPGALRCRCPRRLCDIGGLVPFVVAPRVLTVTCDARVIHTICGSHVFREEPDQSIFLALRAPLAPHIMYIAQSLSARSRTGSVAFGGRCADPPRRRESNVVCVNGLLHLAKTLFHLPDADFLLLRVALAAANSGRCLVRLVLDRC